MLQSAEECCRVLQCVDAWPHAVSRFYSPSKEAQYIKRDPFLHAIKIHLVYQSKEFYIL